MFYLGNGEDILKLNNIKINQFNFGDCKLCLNVILIKHLILNYCSQFELDKEFIYMYYAIIEIYSINPDHMSNPYLLFFISDYPRVE